MVHHKLTGFTDTKLQVIVVEKSPLNEDSMFLTGIEWQLD